MRILASVIVIGGLTLAGCSSSDDGGGGGPSTSIASPNPVDNSVDVNDSSTPGIAPPSGDSEPTPSG